ncbi:MAG: succinyl-diaminopimelate desuccinylase [Desulfovibrionales bacterium]|nr:succinyl-diaminopimelate desuccinylase [Desulfovibrionales bacterium]
MLERVFQAIDNQRELVIELQKNLVSIPALGPDNGGDGERAKADYLLGLLREWRIADIREINAPDDRVPAGHRPNIAAVIPGRDTGKTLWIIGHMDVVPPGERALWDSAPYTLRVEGDLLIGRGVEDNHQGLVMGLLAARTLLDLRLTPSVNLGLLFVSDEETTSRYGLEYVLNHAPGLIKPEDLVLVPDFGGPDSEMVEIAEKTIQHFKITVHGKQCHASTPDGGVNTLPAAADLILKMHGLYNLFPERNELFDPPVSTFEPTKKEANVENVNTIPGRDVFYVDCRVLPETDPDEVTAKVREMAEETAKAYGVTVDVEIPMLQRAAPPTSEDSPVVQKLISNIRRVYGNNPRPQGIGGGTVAAFLRKKGIPAAVWATCMHNAHQPNEKIYLRFLLNDAKVAAGMLLD